MLAALSRFLQTCIPSGSSCTLSVCIFSMCCILMSFADMFRAPGFNQEAFARTIQDIYSLRVMMVVFPYNSFFLGFLNVSY